MFTDTPASTALFARAPTAAAMATLSADEILSCIRACGLAPTKAKNVRKLAEICAAGRPSVLLPLLAGGGHQLANARLLFEAGAASLIEDVALEELGAAVASR